MKEPFLSQTTRRRKGAQMTIKTSRVTVPKLSYSLLQRGLDHRDIKPVKARRTQSDNLLTISQLRAPDNYDLEGRSRAVKYDPRLDTNVSSANLRIRDIPSIEDYVSNEELGAATTIAKHASSSKLNLFATVEGLSAKWVYSNYHNDSKELTYSKPYIIPKLVVYTQQNARFFKLKQSDKLTRQKPIPLSDTFLRKPMPTEQQPKHSRSFSNYRGALDISRLVNPLVGKLRKTE